MRDLAGEFEARGVPLAPTQEVAVPDLSRHALLQGQVAVQDEHRRRASRGSAKASRAATGGMSVRASRWWLFPPVRRRELTWAAACGTPSRPAGRVPASGRPGPELDRRPREPGFVKAFEPVHGIRLKRIPAGLSARSSGGRPAQAKDITFGKNLDESDIFSSRLPDLLADLYAAGMPVFRLLAELPSSPPDEGRGGRAR